MRTRPEQVQSMPAQVLKIEDGGWVGMGIGIMGGVHRAQQQGKTEWRREKCSSLQREGGGWRHWRVEGVRREKRGRLAGTYPQRASADRGSGDPQGPAGGLRACALQCWLGAASQLSLQRSCDLRLTGTELPKLERGTLCLETAAWSRDSRNRWRAFGGPKTAQVQTHSVVSRSPRA